MKIDIVSIFPEIAKASLQESIMKRASESKIVTFKFHNLRDFTFSKNRQVDDYPYGGGAGMVLKPEPFFEAVKYLRTEDSYVILTSPQGKTFCQSKAKHLATNKSHIIILCGQYEGVDHRVIEYIVDEEISIGDYIISNGTLAAGVIADAVVRLIPGVLGNEMSNKEESFTLNEKYIEFPHYTRPPEYNEMNVPKVLLSGNHLEISKWRQKMSINRTKTNRPDLLNK